MTQTIIHVNRSVVGFNKGRAKKDKLPPYIVRFADGKIVYGYAVSVDGKLTFADPRKHLPLRCGAQAYALTKAPVKITGEMSFQQVSELRSKVDQ